MMQGIEVMQTVCPHCGYTVVIHAAYAGQVGTCKACRNSFVAPKFARPETIDVGAATPIPTAAPRQRRVPLVLIATLVLTCGVGATGAYAYRVWQTPAEPLVYLSNAEPYYYYTLSERALSLGLHAQSPTYRESIAIQKGYQLVPPQLAEVNYHEERATRAAREREALAAETELQKARLESERVDDGGVDVITREKMEALFRSAIIGSLANPANAVFGPFYIGRINSLTYRVEVDVDLHGDGTAIQPWAAEVLHNGVDYHVSFIDAGTIYKPTTVIPLLEQRKNRDKTQWKIDMYSKRDRPQPKKEATVLALPSTGEPVGINNRVR